MLTLNIIWKELQKVPADRLEDVYAVIRSFTTKTKTPTDRRSQILKYSGCFSEMTNEDYNDFLHHTNQTRETLFDRDIEI